MIRHIYRVGFELAKLYWFIRRPQSQGSVAIIFHEQDILLVRNTYGRGRWVFPGGGFKKGESPEAAVKREIREEVGINLNHVKLLGKWQFNEYFRHDTTHFFKANTNEKGINVDPHEIAEARWFDFKKLPQNLGISAIRGLELLKSSEL